MRDLQVLTKILPKQEEGDILWIACSGGIDSMFAAQFFNRTREIGLAYFNHGTPYADQAEEFVKNWALQHNVTFVRDKLEAPMPPRTSKEEHWRNERYKFLNELGGPVVTAHHLGDAVETWVWSSLHGKPTLPHLHINNIYRPLLICKKAAMRETLQKTNTPWIEDPSNDDTEFTRNYMRKHVMHHLYAVNPGLDTVIQKKIRTNQTFVLLRNSK